MAKLILVPTPIGNLKDITLYSLKPGSQKKFKSHKSLFKKGEVVGFRKILDYLEKIPGKDNYYRVLEKPRGEAVIIKDVCKDSSSIWEGYVFDTSFDVKDNPHTARAIGRISVPCPKEK